jgi:hypothetical protein
MNNTSISANKNNRNNHTRKELEEFIKAVAENNATRAIEEYLKLKEEKYSIVILNSEIKSNNGLNDYDLIKPLNTNKKIAPKKMNYDAKSLIDSCFKINYSKSNSSNFDDSSSLYGTPRNSNPLINSSKSGDNKLAMFQKADNTLRHQNTWNNSNTVSNFDIDVKKELMRPVSFGEPNINVNPDKNKIISNSNDNKPKNPCGLLSDRLYNVFELLKPNINWDK